MSRRLWQLGHGYSGVGCGPPHVFHGLITQNSGDQRTVTWSHSTWVAGLPPDPGFSSGTNPMTHRMRANGLYVTARCTSGGRVPNFRSPAGTRPQASFSPTCSSWRSSGLSKSYVIVQVASLGPSSGLQDHLDSKVLRSPSCARRGGPRSHREGGDERRLGIAPGQLNYCGPGRG